MYYYNAFIVLVAGTLIVIFSIILSRRRLKPVVIICSIISILLSSAVVFGTRTGNNLEHYLRIVSSGSVEVINQEGSTILPLNYKEYSIFKDLDKPPKYVDERDIEEICVLRFNATDIRLCKLKNAAVYPENVKFFHDGEFYCFLSDKPLYKNAFYLFTEEYAQYVLNRIQL